MKYLLALSGSAVLGLVLVGGNISGVHGAERAATADKAATTSKATASDKDLIHAAPLDDVHFFDEKIRPVLAQNCYKCHTAESAGGLRLDSQQSVMKGGESGPAIVPKDPDNSLLIQAVQQTGDLKMPPKGKKLNDDDIANLVEWVKRGGVWDSTESTKPVVPLLTTVQANASPGAEFFENKIRPILSTQCGSCHIDRWSGGLAMDSRASLVRGGKSGPAIVVGDPDKSLMIAAVEHTGSLQMPQGGTKLTDDQIDALKEWIKIGAPWPTSSAPVRAQGKQITPQMRKFWSFLPLQLPAIPQAKEGTWAKTDIDHFVLAKMEQEGLKPAPQADKRTLIRRATLDLTGLPPTPEEVAAFEKDNSPDAFAKVVDRLLASPRYGETWGRHWLDVARYSDDDIRGLDPRGRGYMPLDGAWVYRDWVIKAINNDVPYGQFIKMQLAGDLLSKTPSEDDLKATGFLGGGPWVWDQAEPVKGRADERNERIDAVTRGMLGLTVACARCHDHKYDPILAKDYYALGGVFASSTYKEYTMVPAAEVDFWKQKFETADHADDAAQAYTKIESDQLAKALAAQTSEYMVAAWKVTGKPQAKLEAAADSARLDPELLARWVKFLQRKQSYYPDLNDWQRMIAQGGTADQAKELADSFQQRVLDLEVEEKKVEDENNKIIIKSDLATRRVKDAKPSDFDTYNQFCPGCRLELKVLSPEKANLYSDLFVRALGSGDEGRGAPGLFSFRGWELIRRLGPVEQQYLSSLSGDMGRGVPKNVPAIYPFVHGYTDKPHPMNIALDIRGNPNTPGSEVQRAFITVLQRPDEKPYVEGSGRLQLADDIVATPIATRVWVNRVWKWHFGAGIVNTPDNFGVAGDPPSDPQLLDYLAVKFRESGMSLKHLQRMIMLSAVYQQSTLESTRAHEEDPNNRFYSHFTLQRLDAEQLRDSMIFVSGDLNLSKMGGPAEALDIHNDRRTVYAKVSRFRLDPFLQAFDFPNPTFTAEQRFSTNVPVQRLYFMNNGFVYAQAEQLADRLNSLPDNAARIKKAYNLLYNRDPAPEELQLGLTFLRTTPDKPGYVVDQEPITAWKEYARILFSSNEFEFLN